MNVSPPPDPQDVFATSLLRFCRLIRLVRIVKVFRLKVMKAGAEGRGDGSGKAGPLMFAELVPWSVKLS